MAVHQFAICNLQSAFRRYWPLIKSLQTGLLLATGIAGYLSAAQPQRRLAHLFRDDRQPVPGHQRQHRAEHGL